MKTKLTVFCTILTVIFMFWAGCKKSPTQKLYVDKGDNSLLIYFGRNISSSEINNFWTEKLSTPDPRGLGTQHKPGIELITSIKTGEFYGIAVKFRDNVNRDIVKKISEIAVNYDGVINVYENKSPPEITEKELQKAEQDRSSLGNLNH